MYTTLEQRINLARSEWEQATAVREALARKMDRVEKKAGKAQGEEYALLSAEIELIRAQYAAVAQLCDQRWDHFAVVQEAA